MRMLHKYVNRLQIKQMNPCFCLRVMQKHSIFLKILWKISTTDNE